MHNRDDLFIKAVLATAMSRAGKAEIEVEVVPAGAQRFDVYSEPDPALAGELAGMGMLGELGAAPTALEPFSDTPGLREMRGCYRKQLHWHLELERRARVAAGDLRDEDREPPVPAPFPHVVVLSPGRPKTVLEAFRFEEVSRGLYALGPGFAVDLVVLSEVPRTRATVLVRLGSAKLRAAAIAEILRMPPDAWERRTAEPFLVKFGLTPDQDDDAEETMTLAEVQRQVEDFRQQLRDEGRDEGRRDGRREGEQGLLLRQLRRRFGELPAAVVARVTAAEPAVLEAWGDRVLTAQRLDEVFGAS